AVEHGVGDGVEAARGQVLGARDEVARGVVQEAGERAAIVPDRLHHCVDRLSVADVDSAGLHRAAVLCRQLARGFLQRVLPAPADVDLGAQLEVPRRHLAAEARAAAGDEDALALENVFLEHDQTVSTILPMCALDSMSACAFEASPRGKVLWMIALILPDSISGQTFSRRLRAIAPLNSTERGRSAEPVTVRRRRRMSLRNTVALDPPRNAMVTMRPSSARHFSSRSR